MLKGCYVETADCARSGWGVVMRRLPMRGGRFGIRERDSISLLAGVVVIELCDTLPYGGCVRALSDSVVEDVEDRRRLGTRARDGVQAQDDNQALTVRGRIETIRCMQ